MSDTAILSITVVVLIIIVWAARYNTWLLIKLTPKGVVFSFLFLLIVIIIVIV